MTSQSSLVRWPQIDASDILAVTRVLENQELTGIGAEALLSFEQKFAHYVGVKHCLGFNGGTAAIHAALFAVGVRPGDEVILPALSFSGSFLPVLALGAKPVFIDIDPRTFNLDPAKIEQKITAKTRAIMPVHLHGLVADMPEIRKVASKFGLVVIEDACQAHGSQYRARKAGSLGSVGCFSLNHTKNLPAGEGGLLVTSNLDILGRAAAFRVFGENLPNRQYTYRPYLTEHAGLNLILPAMSAALAESQLERLDKTNARATVNAQTIEMALGDVDRLTLPYAPPSYTHTYHKYRILLDESIDRDDLLAQLAKRGVPATLWQIKPMPHYPIFKNDDCYYEDFPVTQNVLDHSIIFGNERYPIFAQKFQVISRWCEILKEILQ